MTSEQNEGPLPRSRLIGAILGTASVVIGLLALLFPATQVVAGIIFVAWFIAIAHSIRYGPNAWYKQREFQFSLRTLLVVVILVGVLSASGPPAFVVGHAGNRKIYEPNVVFLVIAALEAAGCTAWYRYRQLSRFIK